MDSSLTLLDVSHFVSATALREVEKEIDIAVEIFLAHQCTRIHYVDLMDDVPVGLAPKAMLLDWSSRDYSQRDSVITQYYKAYPEHFDNGHWHARHFPLFIKFARDRLTNHKFVKSRTRADLFAKSFEDESWREKASSVFGLKLLESMYEKRALRSKEATWLLNVNFTNRELLEKVGRTAGRVAKNSGLESMGDPFKEVVEEHFKARWRLEVSRVAHQDELKMFEKYELDIRRSMHAVFQTSSQIQFLAIPPNF